MIRSELIARVAARNPHLYAREVEAVVAIMLNRIANALTSGDRVELRDFGSFATKELRGRTARNPKTGEVVSVEAKLSIAFKPGKAMRARINRPVAAPQHDGDRSQRDRIIG